LNGAHDIGVSRNARLTVDSSITAARAFNGIFARSNQDFGYTTARIALRSLACNG
jgi:hypothetical protein